MGVRVNWKSVHGFIHFHLIKYLMRKKSDVGSRQLTVDSRQYLNNINDYYLFIIIILNVKCRKQFQFQCTFLLQTKLIVNQNYVSRSWNHLVASRTEFIIIFYFEIFEFRFKYLQYIKSSKPLGKNGLVTTA